MELKTERLILRPVQPGDEAGIHAYAGDRDNTMMFFLPKTFDETVEFVRRNALEWHSADQMNFEFVNLYDGRIIGGCDADLSHSEDRSYATLGWIIHKAYRNRGFATEAACALLDFAFTRLDIDRVYARCDIRNTASFAVMSSIGIRCVNDRGPGPIPGQASPRGSIPA